MTVHSLASNFSNIYNKNQENPYILQQKIESRRKNVNSI